MDVVQAGVLLVLYIAIIIATLNLVLSIIKYFRQPSLWDKDHKRAERYRKDNDSHGTGRPTS